MPNQVQIELFNSDNESQGKIDLPKHDLFPYAETRSASDIRNISKRGGTRSKSFKIPATKNNREILNNIYNINVSSDETTAGFRAVIVVNGIKQSPLLFRVNDVKYVRGVADEFTCQTIGENIEWVELLREKNIRDLDFGETTYSAAFIQSTWDGVYSATPNNTTTFNHVYALIGYGQWAGISQVLPIDMRPAIYIIAIIKKAFSAIGYVLNSKFFSLDSFEHLIIPFIGNGWKNTDAFIDSRHVYANKTSDQTHPTTHTWDVLHFQDTTTPPFSEGSQNNYDETTGKYTADVDMMMTFVCSGRASGVGEVRIVINGNVMAQVSAFSHPMTGALGPFSVQWGPFVLLAGSSIWVEFQPTLAGGVLMPFMIKQDGTVRLTVSGTLLDGQTFPLTQFMPDITCFDIINGLSNLFNLRFTTDVMQKSISIEPRDDYYDSISEAINWTDKIDISKTGELQFDRSYKRSLQFRYKNDGKDGWTKQLNERRDVPLGGADYGLPSKFKEGKETIQSSLYAATYFYFDHQIATSGSVAPLIPVMWKKDEPHPEVSYDFLPRLLYYAGNVRQKNPSGLFARWIFNGSFVDTVPTAFMTDYLGVASGIINLNYSDDTTGGTGLAKTYFGNDLRVIEEGKIISAYFHLTLSDITTIELSNIIYIDMPDWKGYYAINKIKDYSPYDKSINIELIKLIINDPVAIATTAEDHRSPQNEKSGAGPGRAIAGTDGILAKDGFTQYESMVLNNGSPSAALDGSGSVAWGNGVFPSGHRMHGYGNFPKFDEKDVFVVGIGTERELQTGFSIEKSGAVYEGGGEILTLVDGIYQPVYHKDGNDRLQKTLKKNK